MAGQDRIAAGACAQALGARPIRAALFDLDGTLGDTFHPILHVQTEVLGRIVGRPVAEEELYCGFGRTEIASMRPVCGERSQEAFDAYVAQLAREHAACCPAPLPGIGELLSALAARGVRLGLISGRSRETIDISLRQFGLADRFEYVGGGDPDREIKDLCAREALERFGLTTDDAVYVGDAQTDIRFAHAMGMRAIAVCYASNADRAALLRTEPDALCDTVTELREILLSAL